jgi:3-oxoadipate enol-lactonase
MSAMINAGGLRVHYESTGDRKRPVVVLSHALGTDLRLWDGQVDPLARFFRVVRYDIRGHGRSEVTPGPYSIGLLGRDLIALLDALDINAAHIAGVSLGGFIAQWVAANAPDRVGRIVLANTAPRVGTAAGWDSRIAIIRGQGIEGIVDGSISRWFTPEFIAREPATIASIRRALSETSADGYVSCCEAIREMDLRGLAPRIRARTLAVAGARDEATTPSDAEWLARNVPDGRWATYPAAHLANVEARDQFNTEVVQFLSEA